MEDKLQKITTFYNKDKYITPPNLIFNCLCNNYNFKINIPTEDNKKAINEHIKLIKETFNDCICYDFDIPITGIVYKLS